MVKKVIVMSCMLLKIIFFLVVNLIVRFVGRMCRGVLFYRSELRFGGGLDVIGDNVELRI